MAMAERPVRAVGAAGGMAEGRPSRARFWLVALLPIVAIVSVVLWAIAGSTAVTASTDKFVRATVPGAVTVNVHPGTWYLYAEGDVTIPVSAVRVTDPSGQTVPVKASSPGSYPHGGIGGTPSHGFGQFQVPVGSVGDYRVEVITSSASSNGSGFAVGDFSVAKFQLPQRLGVAALLVVNIGAAVAILVMPGARRRRNPGDLQSAARKGRARESTDRAASAP